MVRISLVDFVKGKIKNIEEKIEKKSPTEGEENQLLVKKDSKSNKWINLDDLTVDLKSTYTEKDRLLIATLTNYSMENIIIGSLGNPNGSIDVYIAGNKVDPKYYTIDKETGNIFFTTDIRSEYNLPNQDFVIEIYDSCVDGSRLYFEEGNYGLPGRIMEIDSLYVDFIGKGWGLFGRAPNLRYIKNVVFGPNVDSSITYSSFFASPNLLTKIESIKTTVAPTNTSEMFKECDSLISVPLFDTSNVVNMSDMFSGCSNLTTVPLFDTSNVVNMYCMFYNCFNLTEVPLFDTSNVTNMSGMFGGCSNLTEVPLFNTSNVVNMAYMFSDCSNLITTPLLDTSKVTNMNNMFISCKNLINIPKLDTSNVTDMNGMFYDCTSLTTISFLDTSKVTNTNDMFYNCDKLSYIKLVSTSLENLQNAINQLPTHQDTETGAYIIDLSECTIDVNSIIARDGWTIKLQD